MQIYINNNSYEVKKYSALDQTMINALTLEIQAILKNENENEKLNSLKTLFGLNTADSSNLLQLIWKINKILSSLRHEKEKYCDTYNGMVELLEFVEEQQIPFKNLPNLAGKLKTKNQIEFINHPLKSFCPFEGHNDLQDAFRRLANKKQILISDDTLIKHIENVKIVQYENNEYLSSLNYHKTNHRTALFKDKNSELIAVKVRKKSESFDKFALEYKTLVALREEKENIGLKSEYHPALGVQPFSTLPKSMQESIKSNMFHLNDEIDWNSTDIYLSQPKEAYYEYAQKIENDEKFKESCVKSLHDWFQLVKKGLLFDQLIDLLHDTDPSRNEIGRYLILVWLARNGRVPGEIYKWMETVDKPNMGETGLRDFNEYKKIFEMSKDPNLIPYARTIKEELLSIGDDINDNINDVDATSLNHVLMNEFATLPYIINLITIKRFFSGQLETGKSAIEIYHDLDGWKNVVKLTLDILIEVLKLQEIKDAEISLKESINLDLFAEQMRYWICIPYASDHNEKIPEELHKPDLQKQYGINQESPSDDVRNYLKSGAYIPGSLGFESSINPLLELFKLASTFSLTAFNHLSENKDEQKLNEQASYNDWIEYSYEWLKKCGRKYTNNLAQKIQTRIFFHKLSSEDILQQYNLFSLCRTYLINQFYPENGTQETMKEVYIFYEKLYMASSKEEVKKIIDSSSVKFPVLDNIDDIYLWLELQGEQLAKFLYHNHYQCIPNDWWDADTNTIKNDVKTADIQRIEAAKADKNKTKSMISNTDFDYSSKLSNYSIDSLIDDLIKGLDDYLDNARSTSHLSWMSRTFDHNLEKWRAEFYRNALTSDDLNLPQKSIVAYALFASDSNECNEFKNEVVRALKIQPNNSENAKNHLKNLVRNSWGFGQDPCELSKKIDDIGRAIVEKSNSPNFDYLLDISEAPTIGKELFTSIEKEGSYLLLPP